MADRSDKARNRKTILEAARLAFIDQGASVPLSVVVSQSGLGRGTLYRHFSDRESLIGALLVSRIDQLEDFVSNAPDAGIVEAIIRKFLIYFRETPGLIVQLRTSAIGREYLDALVPRITRLLEDVVRRGRETEEIRANLSVDDVILGLGMLEGVAVVLPSGHSPHALDAAAELLLAAFRHH